MLWSVGPRSGPAWRSEDSAAGQWSSQTYSDQLGGKERRQGREQQVNTKQDLTEDHFYSTCGTATQLPFEGK